MNGYCIGYVPGSVLGLRIKTRAQFLPSRTSKSKQRYLPIDMCTDVKHNKRSYGADFGCFPNADFFFACSARSLLSSSHYEWISTKIGQTAYSLSLLAHSPSSPHCSARAASLPGFWLWIGFRQLKVVGDEGERGQWVCGVYPPLPSCLITWGSLNKNTSHRLIYVWMLGLQWVELFGKDWKVWSCWRRCVMRSWASRPGPALLSLSASWLPIRV